jgi:hypothetical protein
VQALDIRFVIANDLAKRVVKNFGGAHVMIWFQKVRILGGGSHMSRETGDAIADRKAKVFDELAQTIRVQTRQSILPHSAGVFAKLCRVAFQELTVADVAAIQVNNSCKNKLLKSHSTQFCKYASAMGEDALSGLDPNCLSEFVEDLGFSVCDGVAGFSGHMTPSAKNAHFLKPNHYVRTSEVFHNALCEVIRDDKPNVERLHNSAQLPTLPALLHDDKSRLSVATPSTSAGTPCEVKQFSMDVPDIASECSRSSWTSYHIIYREESC